MTHHIFEYISELLIDYFSSASISSGERFHIRYEENAQVEEQYHALKARASSNSKVSVLPFEYNDYKSFSIQFSGIRLIVGANIDGVSERFFDGAAK